MATIEARKLKDGSTRYRVKVRLLGEAPRTRTFKRMTDAKAWAASVETDIGRGTFVPVATDRRRTLAMLIDKFREEAPELAAMKPEHVDWWREEYGYVTLDKLRGDVLSGAKRKLAARKTTKYPDKLVSGATVNRYLATLSRICKWGWKEAGWLPSNPVLSVSKNPESTGIVRFLSDSERDNLLAACKKSEDPNIALAVMLALATGARYSNIRNLTWADVDFAHWRLRFTEVKNGQPRYVPVIGAAQAALQAHYDADPTQQGWVFKGSRADAPADLDKPWRRVREAAKLEDFRFHDLRHTTASYLTMNGASLAEVAEALGHRTLVMAKRYSHQSGEHVRSTLERLAGKLGGTPSG